MRVADIRLLFFTAEPCPTFRPDVTALFGKFLPRFGVYSDLVAGQSAGDAGPAVWGAGKTLLCKPSYGMVGKYVNTLLHAIQQLVQADPRRYQAVLVRDMPVLAAAGLLIAYLKGIPFCYWMSYPLPEGQIALARQRGLSAGFMKWLFPWLRGRVGYFLLYRWVLPRARHVFVQSARMKLDLVARGIESSRMTAVPMGVDLEAMDLKVIAPSSDQRLLGRRVMVYLGSLDRPRKIETLFEMLAKVKRKLPNALLVLAGDTEDHVHRKWLLQQAVAAGVATDVIWTGWLPVQQAWAYVRASELGLSPIPRGELLDCASPTKVPEYLALGLPVVCNDNPDQAALIAASGAGLCVPYSAQEFADACINLLCLATGKRDAMVAAGRQHVAFTRDYIKLAQALAQACKIIL